MLLFSNTLALNFLAPNSTSKFPVFKKVPSLLYYYIYQLFVQCQSLLLLPLKTFSFHFNTIIMCVE